MDKLIFNSKLVSILYYTAEAVIRAEIQIGNRRLNKTAKFANSSNQLYNN